MCHEYRIADRESLAEVKEGREDEPTEEFDPLEVAAEREAAAEEEPPLPTADD